MPLVVETGSGSATADSYCSLADASTYHEKYGSLAAWDALADDETREAALRKATRYVDATYTFSGSKQTAEQALAWPRIGATRFGWLVSEATVPPQVRDAVAQLALDGVTTDLAATGAPEGAVISETVDVLSVTYASGVSGATRYRAAEQLLAGLIYARSTMRISRS